MAEEKSKEDPLIPIMVEVLQTLARLEIKQAMKEGKLSVDMGMDDLFYKGVCFGIAIASEKLSKARKACEAKEQVKKN